VGAEKRAEKRGQWREEVVKKRTSYAVVVVVVAAKMTLKLVGVLAVGMVLEVLVVRAVVLFVLYVGAALTC